VLYSTYCSWLQFVTSCSFHSVCVSLWDLRSYSITYVNFKVLYIGRGNDVIFTCFVAAHVICVAFRMEWGIMNWYKRLISNDTCLSGPRVSNVFMAKIHTSYCGLLVCGSHEEEYKVMYITSCFMPGVGDPFHKRNYTWNQSLGTLHLSCSLSCVITWAVRICRGAASESQKFPPVSFSPSPSV